MAIALRARAPPKGVAMRASLFLGFLLLVPRCALADEPARALAAVTARDAQLPRAEFVTEPRWDFDDAALTRALEARVVAVLDLSAARAAERAVSQLEAREAQRLAELERSEQVAAEQRAGERIPHCAWYVVMSSEGSSSVDDPIP